MAFPLLLKEFYLSIFSSKDGKDTHLSVSARFAQESELILSDFPPRRKRPKPTRREAEGEERRAEEDLTFEEDDEMAAVMGFSGFGSTKKSY